MVITDEDVEKADEEARRDYHYCDEANPPPPDWKAGAALAGFVMLGTFVGLLFGAIVLLKRLFS